MFSVLTAHTFLNLLWCKTLGVNTQPFIWGKFNYVFSWGKDKFWVKNIGFTYENLLIFWGEVLNFSYLTYNLAEVLLSQVLPLSTFGEKKISSRYFSIYCRNLFKTFWEKSSRKTKWVYMKRIGKELSGVMVNIPDLPG